MYECTNAQLELPPGWEASPSIVYSRDPWVVAVEAGGAVDPYDWAARIAEATRRDNVGHELVELARSDALGAPGARLRQRYLAEGEAHYVTSCFFVARGEAWSIVCVGPAEDAATGDGILAHIVESFERED